MSKADEYEQLPLKTLPTTQPTITIVGKTVIDGESNSDRCKTTQRGISAVSGGGVAQHRCKRCRHISARTVLWYLAFVGFAINYMIRINLNITIVDMVVRGDQTTPSIHSKPSECLANTTSIQKPENHIDQLTSTSESNRTSYMAVNQSTQPFEKQISWTPERWLFAKLNVAIPADGFTWNERQQGALLGSFFWLHWALQIPGGMLARRFGTKLVFGVANLLGCVLCAILPIAAYVDYRLLIGVRVLQGLICGVAWPAMHTMTGRWIPPNERSKFITAYLGSSVGVAVFYPLFGYVIAATGAWEWVYHLCAVVGVVWWVAWEWLVFDSPAQHPRICPVEREFIETALADSGAGCASSGGARDGRERTPWRQILTSRPVLVLVLAQWGGVWGLFTLMTQAPTYFRTVHGWTMEATGLLSGLPHLLRMSFAYVFSLLGDWLLRSGRMSRTNVRKLAGVVCYLVNGVFMVALSFSECNSWMAVTMLMAATAAHGAVSTGPLPSLVDLSPRYSGITMGLTGMVSVMPGFISPIIVGQLTFQNQTSHQWMYVFQISAAMLFISGLIYTFFSESELQPWNTPAARRQAATDVPNAQHEQNRRLSARAAVSLLQKTTPQ